MKPTALAVAIILTACYSAAFSQGGRKIVFNLAGSEPSSGTVRQRLENHGKAKASAAELERSVFDLLNSVRRENRLTELEWNEDVATVARMHSRNMAEAKFFSHRGSDGSLVDERADRVGLGSWRAIGENIAYMRGFDDPAELAVEKWMESTAHRKNLLTPTWKESAVGVAITQDGTCYITQVFLLRK
jgi:uncharacterized protein YkwD